MRYAIIENNIVTNICESDGPLPGLHMVLAERADIGNLWDGASFTAPVATPPEVPQSITRAQAKLALLNAGLLDAVQPAIDAVNDAVMRKRMQIEWDDRLTFERSNPTLIGLAGALGMTDAQLDALFVAAAAL